MKAHPRARSRSARQRVGHLRVALALVSPGIPSATSVRIVHRAVRKPTAGIRPVVTRGQWTRLLLGNFLRSSSTMYLVIAISSATAAKIKSQSGPCVKKTTDPRVRAADPQEESQHPRTGQVQQLAGQEKQVAPSLSIRLRSSHRLETARTQLPRGPSRQQVHLLRCEQVASLAWPATPHLGREKVRWK